MLNRNDIIERLAQEGYTKKASAEIIDDVFKVITNALIQGESVRIHGFGTFDTKETAPRDMIDFTTKERVTLPPMRLPRFTAGQHLKKAIKEGFNRA